MRILKAFSESVFSSIQKIAWRVNRKISSCLSYSIKNTSPPFHYSLQGNNHSCFMRSAYLNNHGLLRIQRNNGQGSESFTAVGVEMGVGVFDGEGVMAGVARSVPVTER